MQSEYVVYYSLVALVQISMIGAQTVAILESDDYSIHASEYYTVVVAKFVCSAALHMWLYPIISQSMTLMKFTNNHPEQFEKPNVAFLIVCCSLFINVAAEILNLYMLLYQHSVEHCIIHFVALEIIVEIPHIYAESLVDDNIKARVFGHTHELTVTNKGRDINFWSDRSVFNKIGRFFYCFTRVIYLSVVFYLQPFIVTCCYDLVLSYGGAEGE